jgi:hypothetical protein
MKGIPLPEDIEAEKGIKAQSEAIFLELKKKRTLQELKV